MASLRTVELCFVIPTEHLPPHVGQKVLRWFFILGASSISRRRMLLRKIKDPVGLPLDRWIERERTESYVQPALCNSSHVCLLGISDEFYPHLTKHAFLEYLRIIQVSKALYRRRARKEGRLGCFKTCLYSSMFFRSTVLLTLTSTLLEVVMRKQSHAWRSHRATWTEQMDDAPTFTRYNQAWCTYSTNGLIALGQHWCSVYQAFCKVIVVECQGGGGLWLYHLCPWYSSSRWLVGW